MKRIWRQNEIKQLSEYAHKNWERIVVTSGYFHPLVHSGHLELIREARQFGDCLIVIVNGTKSTIRKYGREIIPIEHRLELISELRPVFACIDYDSDNMCEALKILRPFMFCKGGSDRCLYNDTINKEEIQTCKDLQCIIKDGVGGYDKKMSNSVIIKCMGK